MGFLEKPLQAEVKPCTLKLNPQSEDSFFIKLLADPRL